MIIISNDSESRDSRNRLGGTGESGQRVAKFTHGRTKSGLQRRGINERMRDSRSLQKSEGMRCLPEQADSCQPARKDAATESRGIMLVLVVTIRAAAC